MNITQLQNLGQLVPPIKIQILELQWGKIISHIFHERSIQPNVN